MKSPQGSLLTTFTIFLLFTSKDKLSKKGSDKEPNTHTYTLSVEKKMEKWKKE